MAKLILPDNLRKESKQFIEGVIRNLKKKGTYSDDDNGSLYMLAKSYDTYLMSIDKLNEEGYIIISDRGNQSLSPWVTVQKNAEKTVIELMRDFGLTLKSRTTLKVIADEVEEESELSKFIREGFEK